MTQTVPNFNPRALRGARPFHNSDLQILRIISIHAPLAGRDYQRRGHRNKSRISIHAPLAGRDLPHRLRGPAGPISIHAPLAGRDRADPQAPADFRHFNPRAPCGARLPAPLRPARAAHISIHAPLAGRDRLRPRPEDRGDISIHAPLAGRDLYRRRGKDLADISIHAPLAGRDLPRSTGRCRRTDFNPRAPCGARLGRSQYIRYILPFQSTRPLRGATGRQHLTLPPVAISIHAPLAGRDCGARRAGTGRSHFNPRAPCGARPGTERVHGHTDDISIHAPLAGRDRSASSSPGPPRHFNPRAPCGARQLSHLKAELAELFQSTRPLRGATDKNDNE